MCAKQLKIGGNFNSEKLILVELVELGQLGQNRASRCCINWFRAGKCRINWFVVCISIVLTACSGIDNHRVPVGTWEDASSQRYITIEAAGESEAGLYQAVLFSVLKSKSTVDGAAVTKNVVKHERTLPASMQDGVLVLKANEDINISIMYHPNNQLILVNGVSEFRRVPDELAQITIAELRGIVH